MRFNLKGLLSTRCSKASDWDNAVVKQVCERYIVLNRKCLPSDAEQSHKVRDTALYYAETYQGTFQLHAGYATPCCTVQQATPRVRTWRDQLHDA
jgi:hypothetical protein